MPSSLSLSVAAIAGALMSGCVILPVTVEGYDAACRIVTRHMELKTVQLGAITNCAGPGCQATVIAAAGVTAVSAIVSGSIVVIGNVVYWAEQRASCDALQAS